MMSMNIPAMVTKAALCTTVVVAVGCSQDDSAKDGAAESPLPAEVQAVIDEAADWEKRACACSEFSCVGPLQDEKMQTTDRTRAIREGDEVSFENVERMDDAVDPSLKRGLACLSETIEANKPDLTPPPPPAP